MLWIAMKNTSSLCHIHANWRS